MIWSQKSLVGRILASHDAFLAALAGGMVSEDRPGSWLWMHCSSIGWWEEQWIICKYRRDCTKPRRNYALDPPASKSSATKYLKPIT
jgi:hypothetical protein